MPNWCGARLVAGLNELRPYRPNVVVSGDRRACQSTAQLEQSRSFPSYSRGQSADHYRPALFSVKGRFWRKAAIGKLSMSAKCHVRTFGKVKGRQLPAVPMPHYVLSLNQMRDLGEYLRAYVAYVSANLGWGKALRFVLVWLAGMFLPLGARTLLQLPEWVAMTWMIGWALLGYIFAPYGMWKHHRAQIASSIQPNQKQPR
jgi:hypothetical protein